MELKAGCDQLHGSYLQDGARGLLLPEAEVHVPLSHILHTERMIKRNHFFTRRI
jgi:hypothetical protein